MNTKRRMTGADALVLIGVAAIVAAAALAGCAGPHATQTIGWTKPTTMSGNAGTPSVATDSGQTHAEGAASAAGSPYGKTFESTRNLNLKGNATQSGSTNGPPSGLITPPMPTPYGGQ